MHDFSTFTIEQVEERISSINVEISEASDKERLSELRSEIESLELRKKEILESAKIQAEERAKVAMATDLTIISETPKENRTMSDFAVNSAEYRVAFFKDLAGKEISVEERTALTKAGSVIPTQTMNEIIDVIAQHPLLAELNITRFPNYVSLPVADTVNDASWKDMGTASTDSADVVDNIVLAAYKLIKTIEVEADIGNMAIDALEKWIVESLGEKIQAALVNAVLNGSGTKQPKGVFTEKTATASSITYANLLAVLAAVGGKYHNGAIWTMSSSTFFSSILGLVDGNNRPLVSLVAGIDGKPVYSLLGYKIVLEDAAGAKVAFGNFRKGYAINLGSDVEITSDKSVEFRKGSTVYRAMCLADGKVAIPAAFATIEASEG